MEKIYFSVKGRAKYRLAFIQAFIKMSADFTEKYIGEDNQVIEFNVTCDKESMHILSNEVPLSAYASIAFGHFD